ncbi:MAG: hypothetical protein H5T84_04070 [Thermoleophilia bacterium]|nr:hypothetical protein [Thermoleophilia bacterium]
MAALHGRERARRYLEDITNMAVQTEHHPEQSLWISHGHFDDPALTGCEWVPLVK